MTSEDDPFYLLRRVRGWLKIWYDEDDRRYHYEPSTPALERFAAILTCFRCASVWIGIGFALLYRFRRNLALALAWPLALSGAAIIVEDMLDDSGFDGDADTP